MLIERFRRFVGAPTERGCTEWRGNRGPLGYGRFKTADGRQWSAHRMSWMIAHGPIPAGAQVLHSCDNPPCVAPEHLRLGTHADNMADKRARLRVAGERNTNARLEARQVIEIRALAGELPLVVLAARYGVAKATINAVIQRRTWRHL